MAIRYLDPIERLEYELIQRRLDGYDTRWADQELQQMNNQNQSTESRNIQQKAMEILISLHNQSISEELLLNEPNSIESIQAHRPDNHIDRFESISLSDEEYSEAVLGGWLGRASGCLLGKPIEKYHRDVIREILESNGEWPLSDYFTQKGMPAEILKKYPWKRRWGIESLRENIECMPDDDDLNYTILNLHVLEEYGFGFTSLDIGVEWLKKVPVYETFTAERIAYYNLLSGLEPPETASYLNPFREWIGAQIRADFWGYVSPGQPEQAAALAWRDGSLSHVRNGIYGEMFFAALIAGAFIEKDLHKLIQIGLGQIPINCRLAKAIQFVLDLPMKTLDWETVVDALYQQFEQYHWVHTINNAALITAALLYSAGDFENTICNTVMGGWDTDSCGATAGSVIGVIHGAGALPEKWIAPLNNHIRSSLMGFDYSQFTDLANRTVRVAQLIDNYTATTKTNLSDDY